MPDALIVGGGGFLGRRLTQLLLEENWRVEHLSAASRSVSGRSVAVHAVPDYSLASARRVLASRSFDHVFLLAAAGVHPGERGLDDLFAVNVAWPATLLTALLPSLPHVTWAGSWMEYDAAPGVRLTEDHSLGGVEAYGASKAAGDLWLAGLARHHGFKLARLRLFQLYGPGEAPHRLTAMLLQKLRRHLPVPLSPGAQVRDFLHVADAADALFQAARLGLNGVYNVCSGLPVTVADFARTLASALGAPSDLLRFGDLGYRDQELMWAVGSPDRFQGAASWRPRLSLPEGLALLAREVA